MRGHKELTDMYRWMLATVSVLSLSSCMMGPDYKKPETPAGDAWPACAP